MAAAAAFTVHSLNDKIETQEEKKNRIGRKGRKEGRGVRSFDGGSSSKGGGKMGWRGRDEGTAAGWQEEGENVCLVADGKRERERFFPSSSISSSFLTHFVINAPSSRLTRLSAANTNTKQF